MFFVFMPEAYRVAAQEAWNARKEVLLPGCLAYSPR
jgi:hypothetical protein